MTATIENPVALTEDIRAELAHLNDLDQRKSGLWEPKREEVRSIFADRTENYTQYRVEVKVVDRIMGGTPQKADLIAGWLKKNLGVTDQEEVIAAVRSVLSDLGQDVPEDATLEQLTAAAEIVGAERHGNTFRRDDTGLFLEGRVVKSMLKESTNICFATRKSSERWGPTGKGPKDALAEWVFVSDLRLHLMRDGEAIREPDGTFTMHGVVGGPQGKRSTLTQYAYCVQPTITFTVKSFMDRVTEDQWVTILQHSELIGLGAIRSQSFGQFAVQAFDKL